jgi:hypothetical protein
MVLIQCELSRGGFSSERVFRIEAADGGTLVGVADLSYCYDRAGERLKPDQPAAGKRVHGLVSARVIREEGDAVLLSVPDGSVASVLRGVIVKEGLARVSHQP